MTTGELLTIEPQDLQFPFELKKQISCSMQLRNNTNDYVAFKVKTTNPKKYCVRPNTGVVLPHSTCDVIVTMQAQKEVPPDMQCKDKFLLQSAFASPGATTKDVTPELFNKESGNQVDECKLKVTYVDPPQPPSPVREGSEEGSSPRASVSDNGTTNTSDHSVIARDASSYSFSFPLLLEATHFPEIHAKTSQRKLVARASTDSHETSSETRALISKLTDEKNSAIQQTTMLHQELELLRRQGSKIRGGFPTIYIVIIAVLGFLLGYLVK